MDEKSKKLLIQAYKREKRGTIKGRIHAVCMVKIRGLGVSEVASLCFCDPHTVTSWVRHFESEGLAGLEDRPRPGRPPKVGLEKIAGLAARTGSITTPKQLKENIRKEFKVTYHISNVTKIMHRLGLSAKTARRIHVNRPEIKKIRQWQRNAKRRISRLQEKGFLPVVFDEAIFVDDPASGVKYWSPEGEPIVTTYKGRHGKVVAYGSIVTDGRQFFRTHEKFDKETVLQYLKDLVRHFGKVVVIMDNAPQHKSRIVMKFLKENPDIKVMWLPAATPELSGVEEYWHQAKRNVLVSEYYATIVQMRNAMSEYFRTARPRIDVMEFICRKSLNVKNF